MTAAKADSIQVQSFEETPILHRLEVEVDGQHVKRAFDRAYKDLAKQARVKGFRPGKAPRSVLDKLYGASVAEQLEHTLVAETLADAIEQSGLEAVSEPAIEAAAPRDGESFSYIARIDVKPKIDLPDLAGLPARRPKVEVGEEELIAEIELLRERNASMVEEPEATVIDQGHTVTMDFVGRVDGKPFEGGSAQGFELEVGSGRFIPGFEEQLVGAKSGDDCEFQVTFPEDYGNAELAGKDAVFAVHVAAVKRRVLPELDDEFAKDLGDFETLKDLRNSVREDMTKLRERNADQELHRTLLDSLIERASFDVPPGMVEQQLQHQLRSAHDRFAGAIDHDTLHQQLEQWKGQWRESAHRKVQEALLLEAVARTHQIKVSPEEVEARIQEMAEQQGVDPARLRQQHGGDDLVRALEGQLADEKALEFLSSQARVEETTDT